MTNILISIDCAVDKCGRCAYFSPDYAGQVNGLGICGLFSDDVKTGRRIPACIEAERRAKGEKP